MLIEAALYERQARQDERDAAAIEVKVKIAGEVIKALRKSGR